MASMVVLYQRSSFFTLFSSSEQYLSAHRIIVLYSSVADPDWIWINKRNNYNFWKLGWKQCCGSGMFIPDPGSWFLPIPDPGSRIPDLGSRISDPGSRIQNPGSGKNLFRIPDPGVKKAPDPGSRIRIRNTGWKEKITNWFKELAVHFAISPAAPKKMGLELDSQQKSVIISVF